MKRTISNIGAWVQEIEGYTPKLSNGHELGFWNRVCRIVHQVLLQYWSVSVTGTTKWEDSYNTGVLQLNSQRRTIIESS